MISQVIRVSINKRLFVLPPRLLGCMNSLHDSPHNNVWDVQEPEADGKKHELDVVADEEVVILQQVLRQILGPGL